MSLLSSTPGVGHTHGRPNASHDPLDEHIARLVAEAPRLSPAKLATLQLIIGPVLAELAAEDAARGIEFGTEAE